MDLNHCSQCGAPAVGQVRGDLNPGDLGWVHPDQHIDTQTFLKTYKPGDEIRNPSIPDNFSSNHPVNGPDYRVTCTVCENSTGWKPGSMEHEYVHYLWNKDNPVSEVHDHT